MYYTILQYIFYINVIQFFIFYYIICHYYIILYDVLKNTLLVE